MSTLADSMLSWKANLTTRATPEQVLTLRADVNAFADGVRFLESENAKLRELVHDALLARNNPCFWDYFEPYSFWTDWTNRACDLGIEVE